MSNAIQLIDRYIAVWNEQDAGRRHALISETWNEGGRYVDPVLAGDGHAGIDAMTAAVHAKYPGYRFRRTGDVDLHNDRARFTWSLAPEDGPALVQGTDFAVIANGRLDQVTGFFDHVAVAA